MTKGFYEYVAELDELKQRADPTADDLTDVLKIIDGDEELAVWFYEERKLDETKRISLAPGWVPLLRKAGEFEELGGVAEKATFLWRCKARYLAESAAKQPAEVSQVIREIRPFDAIIQSHFLDALLNLPIEVGVRASWIIWDCLSGREYRVWVWVGQPVAKFMVKVMESDVDLAFRIARYLLEIWNDEGKGDSLLRGATWRFEDAYEYSNLMCEYLKEMWEAHPFRAVTLLVRTLDSYLEEVGKNKNYDVSTHFHVSVENLDKIEKADRDHETVLTAAICEAGKAVIAKEADRIPDLLGMLRRADKQIFKRIEMYLLGFVPSGTETARIEEIVADTGLLDSYGFKYEYALLVTAKQAEISEATRNALVRLVKQTHVDNPERFAEWFRETRGREYTPEDLERYENRMRAEKLYLVREVFPEQYEKYKTKAEAEDEELEPQPMVGRARCISRTEGSPATVEELVEKDPLEVFTYLTDSSRRKVGKREADSFFDPKDALSAVFQQVVKQRIGDYVAEEQTEHVVQLESGFSDAYFHGVWDAIRGGEWKRDSWKALLAIAKAFVDAHKSDSACGDAFRAMLSGLRDAFGEGEKSLAFDTRAVQTFWNILEPLVRYEEPAVRNEHERDPIQLRCSSVKGNALDQVVSLGIVCKRDHPEFYKEKLKEGVCELFEYVIDEVRRPEVNCTFGIDFARLTWLDKEWICDHTDAIFAGDMWGAVWGTYVSWGRPSRQAFDLLYERGKYRQAVETIGEESPWKFGKKVEKGLSDHLMIALFNGWLDIDPDGLLNAFLDRAPAKLRGHAADFLTSGFAALKERPDTEVSERLRKYWEQRLASMEKDPQGHKEEAFQFLYWPKDSPLEARETLALLERTLDITGGQMGPDHFPRAFFEGIRDMAPGNELIALRCLKRVMGEERMRRYISLYEKHIDALFQHVLGLADEYADVDKIRQEAMQLADSLGRLHVYQFRPVYEKLSKKI